MWDMDVATLLKKIMLASVMTKTILRFKENSSRILLSDQRLDFMAFVLL